MRAFISYRREDTSGYAGRLFDRLTAAFGRDSVFMDIDSLAPGQDFVDVIDDALRGCEVALVLIGPSWLTITDQLGRRLDAPNDFVRQEIAAALGRGLRVLPLLVGGAAMPPTDALPVAIADLARRHAFELTDRRWHTDVDELVAALGGAANHPPPPPRPSRTPVLVATGAAVAVVTLGVALALLLRGPGGGNPTPTPTPSALTRLTADATTSSGAHSILSFLMQNDGRVVYLDLACFTAGFPGKGNTSYCLDKDSTVDSNEGPGSGLSSNYLEVFSTAPSMACGSACDPAPPSSGIHVLSITLVADSVFQNLQGAGSLELKGYFSVAVVGTVGDLPSQYSVIRLDGVPTVQAPH